MSKNDSFLEKALNKYKEKNFDAAYLDLDNVLEMNSCINNELVRNGMILINLERFEEALIYLEKILEINPEDSELVIRKGVIFEKLSRHDESLTHIDKALSLNPRNITALRLESNYF